MEENMIKAMIDGKEHAFRDEAALVAFQTAEELPNANAVRQSRWRRNHSKAAQYWLWRIKHGIELPAMLASVSDEVIEQERLLAVESFPDFLRLYPDRGVTKIKNKNSNERDLSEHPHY